MDLNNFSEKLVENIPYNTNDYDSNNQLNIIHKFDNNIYLKYEVKHYNYNKKGKMVNC